MIHSRPNCFHCEKVVEYDPIYAPPMCDHPDCASAIFHPLCLMEWREKRAYMLGKMRESMQAFRRHLRGECGCADD